MSKFKIVCIDANGVQAGEAETVEGEYMGISSLGSLAIFKDKPSATQTERHTTFEVPEPVALFAPGFWRSCVKEVT